MQIGDRVLIENMPDHAGAVGIVASFRGPLVWINVGGKMLGVPEHQLTLVDDRNL